MAEQSVPATVAPGPSAPTTSAPTTSAPATSAPATSTLRRLAGDVQGDLAIVDHFVADYLSLLDLRLDRLALLLAAGDDEAAVVSILSLETTSVMIGADDVVTAARAVRRAVEAPAGDQTQQAFDALKAAVRSTRTSLTDLGFTASQ